MCLSKIDKSKLRASTMVQDGWKEFSGSKSKPEFQSFSYKNSRTVPLDQWIQADGKEILANDYNKYKADFHVYINGPGAGLSKLDRRRVFVRKVHTIGNQDGEEVMIAEEMYVPSDPDAWPPSLTFNPTSTSSPIQSIIDKMSGLIDELKKTAANA